MRKNYFEKERRKTRICRLRKMKNMKLEKGKEIHESRAEQKQRLKQTGRSGLVNKYSQADN